ncbi:MAG: type II toxin-antitoxin system VapB family antitoxin [Vulcanimicrobiota bacterium]
MKTTVEIPDALLQEAKRLAAEEQTSVKALIQEGLQRVIELRARAKRSFQLKRASVPGNGLREEYAQGGWEAIRDAAYQGRGS